MSKAEIRERERRWAMPVFVASVLSVILFAAAVVVNRSAELSSDASSAMQLTQFAENHTTFVLSAILQAVSIGLLAAPLLYLFRAAQARSDAVRSALVGIMIAGPLLFSAGGIVQTVGFDHVSSDFVLSETDCADKTGSDQDDCVDDIIRGDSVVSVGGGLSLAGSLGLLAGLVYTCLQAMRIGLLTRFFGTLGMALGVAVLLFGPLGPPAVIVYSLALGLLYINRWPAGRPPAWDAVEAIPWPKPGEQPPAPPPSTQPGDVEGTADEILGTDQGSNGSNGSSGEGPQRRKRKRR